MEKVIELFNRMEETEMYIGVELKERMDSLDISIAKLANEALVDEKQIGDILNNKVSIDEIDEVDLDLISQTLYCKPDYFISKDVRGRDILNSSMNRGTSDSYVNLLKGKLQQFGNDFDFLRNIRNDAFKGEN